MIWFRDVLLIKYQFEVFELFLGLRNVNAWKCGWMIGKQMENIQFCHPMSPLKTSNWPLIILSDEKISSESDESAKLCELITVFFFLCVCVCLTSNNNHSNLTNNHPSIHPSVNISNSSSIGSYYHTHFTRSRRGVGIHRRFGHFRVLVTSIYRTQSVHFVSCNIIYIHSCFYCYSHLRVRWCDITKTACLLTLLARLLVKRTHFVCVYIESGKWIWESKRERNCHFIRPYLMSMWYFVYDTLCMDSFPIEIYQ